MNFAKVWKKISMFLEFLSKIITWVGSVVLAVGLVSKFFEWGKSGPFRILKDNIQFVWLITLSAVALMLLVWISRLHKRFVSGFSDTLAGDLGANWDFKGSWSIAEKNTLLVTDSDAGGITKIGAQWENYTFEFKARIMERCLGVIVRALDLNNYYMFQITNEKIHPHRRAAVPSIDTSPKPLQETVKNEGRTFNPITIIVGWELFDPPISLPRRLDDWFKVKVIVRGESVVIYIDDELVCKQDSFLKIPTGKVGFRNYGTEKALIRNVKVTLQT